MKTDMKTDMKSINTSRVGYPEITSGTKVICTRTIYAVEAGTELVYISSALDDETGWRVFLEGGEPNYFPGETVRDVGTHTFTVSEFTTRFMEVV